MKRLAVLLILVLATTSLFAGGKYCETQKAKSVSLTGTIATNADGGKIFRVSDSGKTLTLCHKTKADVLKLGENGATLEVKGKVVACDEAEGEELFIETAKRI
jgi:hypothetical protein